MQSVDDIIPLLEEYCYEDYGTLGNILGEQIVDVATERVRHELFDDGQEDALVQGLLAPFVDISTSSEALATDESQAEADEDEEGGRVMTIALISVTLSEWETLGPDKCSDLDGRFLDPSLGTRHVVERLTDSKLLGLTELRHGLQIKAYSHVGRIRVGDLNITVLPKIKGTSLLSLVRYAYGFRRLNLISDSTHLVDHCGFEDLLISQLNAEVQELVSRGLLRAYIGTTERLSSPRGRIDLNRMALDGGTVTATLQCQHHPRIEDTLLNRVLMAGLQLAATMASIVDLRRESRRLASLMEEQVSKVRLDGIILERATPTDESSHHGVLFGVVDYPPAV